MKVSSLAAIAASAGLALAATQAQATVFAGYWTLEIGDNSDPGHLRISTSSLGDTFYEDLGAPNPEFSYDHLFNIWTTEGSIEADDLNGTTLKLTFTFTDPGGNDGPIEFNGESSGYSYGFLGRIQGGQLTWDNGGVAQLKWGFNNPNLIDPGRMTLTVYGGTFNEGSFWSTDQGCFFGHHCNPQNRAEGIKAKFHWDNDPTFGAVPEPGTWALMIGGFGLAGAALRRRRSLALA